MRYSTAQCCLPLLLHEGVLYHVFTIYTSEAGANTEGGGLRGRRPPPPPQKKTNKEKKKKKKERKKN